jgi:hypothetical protein
MAAGHWNKAAGQGEFQGPGWYDVAVAWAWIQDEFLCQVSIRAQLVMLANGRWGFRLEAWVDGQRFEGVGAGWGSAYPDQVKYAPAAYQNLLLKLSDALEERRTASRPNLVQGTWIDEV